MNAPSKQIRIASVDETIDIVGSEARGYLDQINAIKCCRDSDDPHLRYLRSQLSDLQDELNALRGLK